MNENRAEAEKCLKQLKLPPEKIKEYMNGYDSGNTALQLRILSDFRKECVESMHGIYRNLECLDYIIAQIERGENK